MDISINPSQIKKNDNKMNNIDSSLKALLSVVVPLSVLFELFVVLLVDEFPPLHETHLLEVVLQ